MKNQGKKFMIMRQKKAGNPEMSYMIGDNPVADYQGGLAAGMIPILVHNVEPGKTCCEKLTDLFEFIPE